MQRESTTKPVRWTQHAEGKLSYREADRIEVERTIDHPHIILPAEPPRKIYQRSYFDAALGQQMLPRVVVEETATERIIITLYRTSKLDKYQA
jgi:hypothetical protein